MILAQAMTAVPFILFLIWGIAFVSVAVFLLLLKFLYRRLRGEELISPRETWIIAAMVASLVCGFFLYKMLVFKGPWIN